MHLLALVTAVDTAGHIKPGRLKDITSSARQYATLLGYPDPAQCPAVAYTKPKPVRDELIETKMTEASVIKLRNLKNNLSFLFRHAEELGLVRLHNVTRLPQAHAFSGRGLLPRVLSEAQQWRRDRYGLLPQDWPPALRQEYDKWERWATADFVVGRPAARRVRWSTVAQRKHIFQAFFGYLTNILHLPQVTFALCTDVALITECVQWFVRERRGGRVTHTAHHIVDQFQSLARHYFKDLEAARALGELRIQLGKVQPLKDKTARMVSVTDLINVAVSDFPKRRPPAMNGRRLANQAGRAVAVLLLATRPLRNQNYREARIGTHIAKASDGKWYLAFSGADGPAALKRKERNGALNVYKTDIPAFVVPYLEQYLSVWRPLLTTDPANDLLFLTHAGNPYDRGEFGRWIKKATLKWLGKQVNPHLFRNIVATGIINDTNDYIAAAALLNDDPATVFKNYWHLDQQRAATVTDQWLTKQMGVVSPTLLPTTLEKRDSGPQGVGVTRKRG